MAVTRPPLVEHPHLSLVIVPRPRPACMDHGQNGPAAGLLGLGSPVLNFNSSRFVSEAQAPRPEPETWSVELGQ